MKMRMSYLLLLLLLVNCCWAQNLSPGTQLRKSRPLGLNAQLGLPTGVLAQFYISPSLEAVAFFGPNLDTKSYHWGLVGLNYFLGTKSNSKWSYYIGAQASTFYYDPWLVYYPNPGSDQDNAGRSSLIFVPAGTQVITKKGFSFGFELGPYQTFGTIDFRSLMGNIRLGYRFKLK